jgi:hypothetical protein
MHYSANCKTLMNVFVTSTGCILLISALAKIISTFGKAGILYHRDPFLNVSFRDVMFLAALLELLVAGFCLISNRTYLCLKLVAWLSTLIAIYRIGLWYSGWHRPCVCMGTVVDDLPISPQLADLIMKIILAYFIVGSYSMMLLLWRTNRTALRLSAGQVLTARE